MTTTTTATDVASSNAALFASLNGSGAAVGKAATTAKEQNDRFLKLLTTQLTNQDPLNPLDNAQMTSQMAQISTVSGLEQLNLAMESLASQFIQLQAMQGASLVGRSVTMEGNALSVSGGQASGAFETASPADRVSVEVLNPAGQVVKTVNLGPQTAGRHDFNFADTGLIGGTAYSFRISAQSGSTTLDATTMVHDKVNAVNTSGKTLTLELAHGGQVPYSAIKSIN